MFIKTRLYKILEGMKQRCYNPNNSAYKYYGAKGITVCDEWRYSFPSFEEWAFANGYDANLTIDRINKDEGYYPSNCRWVTMKEQNRNRGTVYDIEGMTLREYCKKYGLSYFAIAQYKHVHKCSIEEAIEFQRREKKHVR